MLQKAIIATVDSCIRHAKQVIGIAILLGIVSGIYAAAHFAIDADVNKLISKDLPWRKIEAAFDASFPPKEVTTLAVVDAPTSELATQATSALVQKLSEQPKLFRAIEEIGGGPFFQRNGLLFLPTQQVVETTKKLGEGKAVIQALAQDSSLRGLITALNYGLIGAKMNHYKLDDLTGTFNMVSDTLEGVSDGRPASFSWRAMLNGAPPTPSQRRRLIEIRPVLDFSALTPGHESSKAIRKAAADLDIASKYSARLRLTGPVPIADEEYATVQEGAIVNTAGAILVVLTILWLALRSGRIILAVFISLLVGLSITMAVGLAMVGALNLISVAFAVLFVGLGVDFGIQFSVRYRAERHEIDRLYEALVNTAKSVGAQLTLAATAVAAGFLIVPADRLSRRVGAWTARRRRHDHRVHHQHHGDPGLAVIVKPAGRARAARLQIARAGRSVHGAAAHPDHHRHGARGRRRPAAALFPAVRFQSDQSAQPQGRVGRDLPRSAERSHARRQRDLRAGAEQGSREG